jgi:hypothetical protein
MDMISVIWIKTQSKNITSPQNNLDKTPQRCYKVPIYTNREGDGVDLKGGDCADIDVDAPTPRMIWWRQRIRFPLGGGRETTRYALSME